MFFTKKYNYFSRETRWYHPFLWRYDGMKLKNQVLKNQLSFWLLCKFTWIYKKMDFSKFDFSTSSYHNSTNNGPIDMFFTKKCNYFSRERRWNNSILSQTPLKGSNCNFKLTGKFIWRRL